MSDVPAVDYRIIATLTGQPLEMVVASPQVRQICTLLTRDTLTGLYNRRYLQLRLAIELQEGAGSELSLLVLDLDQFKSVNDRFGHAAGDQVLVETARAIRRHLPPDGVAARFGGDEFLVALPEWSGPDAVVWATNLLSELRHLELTLEDGTRLAGCSGSIGITTWPQDTSDPDQLFKQADQAMFRAKRCRRGTCLSGQDANSPDLPWSALRSGGGAGSMRNLPTGSVTLLFSQLGSDAQNVLTADALVRHDSLAAGMAEQHGGVVFGRRLLDGTVEAAFARPEAAVAAAVSLQRLHSKHPCADSVGARVALYSGKTELSHDTYVGEGISRCLQFRQMAHPGQVLLCPTTADRVRDRLPARVELEDLGQHRLADLFNVEQVFQLQMAGFTPAFPPPRSLSTLPNNLPEQSTRFIGREVEIGQVREQLTAAQLVTLTGAGGSGKSRLALQVAAQLLEQCPDGVWWVPLAALSEPGMVERVVAETLGVEEQPGIPLRRSLVAHLLDRPALLLVLDNCEHLGAACADLAGHLVGACPRLRLLATSRNPLGLTVESLLSVPPLSLPVPGAVKAAEMLNSEAVQLFLDRAQASQPGFNLAAENGPAVAQICRRLDGIPLAIQLAAARVKVLSPADILQRLEDRFLVLSGGNQAAPPRHQTLRAAMDWSHTLLTDRERTLWQRLAVFTGSFSETAAVTVTADEVLPAAEIPEVLASLVDRSLLVTYPDDAARFAQLETIRHYGLERLQETGREDEWRRRHAEWCLDLAETAAPYLRGSRTAVLPEAADWLSRLEQDHANLSAALQWCARVNDTELGLRLVAALAPFWRWRSHFVAGRDWVLTFLERSSEHTVTWARAVVAASELLRLSGESHRTGQFLKLSLRVLRAAKDQQATATTLHLLGRLAAFQAEYVQAERWLGQAVAAWQLLDEGPELIRTLADTWHVARQMGRHRRAAARLQECLTLARTRGDRCLLAEVLHEIGQWAQVLEQWTVAQELLVEALDLSRELGDRPGVARAAFNLGKIAFAQGDVAKSVQLFTESLAIRRRLGYKLTIADNLTLLGLVAREAGDFDTAAVHMREALLLRHELEDRWGIATCLRNVAGLAIAQGEAEHGARLLGAAAILWEVLGSPQAIPTEAQLAATYAAVARSDLGEWRFQETVAEGRAMPVAAAVQYALAYVAPGAAEKRTARRRTPGAAPHPFQAAAAAKGDP